VAGKISSVDGLLLVNVWTGWSGSQQTGRIPEEAAC